MSGDLTSACLEHKKSISAALDCHPFFDAARDLAPNPNVGSFYVVSYVQDGEEKFTIVFHLMIVFSSIGTPLAQLAISVLNETNLEYLQNEMNHLWLKDTTIMSPGLNIRTPEGHLQGDINKLCVVGRIPGSTSSDEFSMEFEMTPLGPVLPSLLTGAIPFSNSVNYEFALPKMKTSGKITVRGKEHKVTGWSWLDREWGSLGPSKWTWMNVQLDNDVQMSIWDEQTDDSDPKSYVNAPGATDARRFATIMHPTGDLALSPVIIQELGAPWTSKASGRTYPDKWCVTIPGKANLTVQSLKSGQEIVSKIQASRVEAKARIDGTFDTKSVTGVTMVELFDLFPLFRAF